MIKAVYPGTFDPLTTGHLDIIKRSMGFCTHLVVAIGDNPGKKTLFSIEERIKQIDMTINENVDFLVSTNISVTSFPGLLVNFAKEVQAKVLVRGIRSVSDFEYELTLAGVNKTLAPEVETVFLPTSPDLAVVSSSMVKEIARHGGDINKFTYPHIVEAVNKKLGVVKEKKQEGCTCGNWNYCDFCLKRNSDVTK